MPPAAPMAAPGCLAAAHHSGARSLRLIAGATDARLPSCCARDLQPQRLKPHAALMPRRLLPAIHAHCKQTSRKIVVLALRCAGAHTCSQDCPQADPPSPHCCMPWHAQATQVSLLLNCNSPEARLPPGAGVEASLLFGSCRACCPALAPWPPLLLPSGAGASKGDGRRACMAAMAESL